MAVDLLGALTVVSYYLTVVYLGIRAGRKVHSSRSELWQSRSGLSTSKLREAEGSGYFIELFVANRSVPLFMSAISMTATWVGGGYINGSAEAVFNYGMLWCHAPLGYAISLFVGGRLFAGKMRFSRALTMLDPFQQHYGPWIAVMLCLPAVCGEVLWMASILAALGETAQSLIKVNSTVSIIVSMVLVLIYVLPGGYYSVVYTDAFQLMSTFIGLWACVPYFLTNSAVGQIKPPEGDWIGVIDSMDFIQIVDQLCMTIFGGIPWQVYFQRILGSETVFSAQMLSYLSAIGCLLLAVPPVVIGAVAKTTNFTAAGYPGPYNLHKEHRKDVLATAIHYMTPPSVSALGLTAIIAAVMSSVDSSMLSASSLITRNIYHFIFRPTASDGEVAAVLRVTLCLVGAVSTLTAMRVNSVFTLWTLSSDLVYVLLFPQFVSLFFLRNESNAYGAFVGFVAGIVLRALCGEPSINVPATIRLPLYDSERGQQFPFRTLCMLSSLFITVMTSALAAASFRRKLIPEQLDVWRCFVTPHDQRFSTADAQRTVSLAPGGHNDGHTAASVDSRDAVRAAVKQGNLAIIFPSHSALTSPTTQSNVSSVRKELAPVESEMIEASFSPKFAQIESETTDLSSRAPEDQNVAVDMQIPPSPSFKADASAVPDVKPQGGRQKRLKPKHSKVASRDSDTAGIPSVDRNDGTKRKVGRAKADKGGSPGPRGKRFKASRARSLDAKVSATEQVLKATHLEVPKEEAATVAQETPRTTSDKPKADEGIADARARQEVEAGSREIPEDFTTVSKDMSTTRRVKKRRKK